jgi:hypothetical protein
MRKKDRIDLGHPADETGKGLTGFAVSMGEMATSK